MFIHTHTHTLILIAFALFVSQTKQNKSFL